MIVVEDEVKKTVYIVVTVLIMLIVSRFMVRIVDATVGIDQDFGILVLFLILVNSLIDHRQHPDRVHRISMLPQIMKKQKNHKEQAPGQR